MFRNNVSVHQSRFIKQIKENLYKGIVYCVKQKKEALDILIRKELQDTLLSEKKKSKFITM